MAGPARRRWILFLVAGLGLTWAVLAGLSLLAADRDVHRGLRAIDAVRGRADAAAVADGRLLPDLRAARAAFDAGHRRVGGPLLLPARLLPVAGRQLRSVEALSAAATTVADVAIDGITEAQPILDDPGGSNTARATSARRLGELAGRAGARLAGVRLGPRAALLGALADARTRLSSQLDELRDAVDKAAKGGAAVADLLQGPRRYLVFAANTAEMRAGAGMLLSAGELETGPAGLKLSPMQTVTEIPQDTAVPLTGDLAARWGWLSPNLDWRNLMTSPRFDEAAPLAARMWQNAGHPPVDGVMVLDPEALAALLGATGPVEVEGRRFDKSNIEQELLHDQYLRFPANEDKPERREALGKIAGAVFTVLDAGRWSLPNLASGMAHAAGGRHVLLWSASPGEESAWHSLGVDGTLQPDSLLVAVLNRAGAKMDPFVRVDADVEVHAAGGGTDVTVTVNIANQVPAGEPRYVAGPHPLSGVGEGVYVGILTVSMPGAATGARFDGVDTLAVAGSDGPTQVIGFQFDLARGAQRTVVARFRLPSTSGMLRVEPSARVPPIAWRSGASSWADSSPKFVSWNA